MRSTRGNTKVVRKRNGARNATRKRIKKGEERREKRENEV